jgi:hypothetical protein
LAELIEPLFEVPDKGQESRQAGKSQTQAQVSSGRGQEVSEVVDERLDPLFDHQRAVVEAEEEAVVGLWKVVIHVLPRVHVVEVQFEVETYTKRRNSFKYFYHKISIKMNPSNDNQIKPDF